MMSKRYCFPCSNHRVLPTFRKALLTTHRAFLTIALCLLCQTASAGPYQVDVKKELNGLNIVLSITKIDVGSITHVTLSNYDKQAAHCRLKFDAKIEQAKRFVRKIAPGTSSSVKFSPRTQPRRLYIRVTCTPASSE